MHNCKTTRDTLIGLALNPPDQNQPLPVEIETCAACREEYASFRNALRVADQTRTTALPAENFWAGYQVRLRHRLDSVSQAQAPAVRTSFTAQLRSLLTGSVRVPVPVAAVLLIFIGVSFVFALNSRRPLPTAPIAIVTKTIEVPVTRETVRERVVTRTIYRAATRNQPPVAATNAVALRSEAARTPISLVGFKPTSEINLTVIKGSYRDDK